MNNIPTVGKWYDQLSSLRKIIFNILCRIIGDLNAIEVCGYRKYVKN
jgi:hypothetical protein